MSCAGVVLVLSDKNLPCASGVFTNAFKENVDIRSSVALLGYSISSRLNARPERTSPSPKTTYIMKLQYQIHLL